MGACVLKCQAYLQQQSWMGRTSGQLKAPWFAMSLSRCLRFKRFVLFADCIDSWHLPAFLFYLSFLERPEGKSRKHEVGLTRDTGKVAASRLSCSPECFRVSLKRARALLEEFAWICCLWLWLKSPTTIWVKDNAGDEEEEVDLTDGLLPLSGPGRVKFQLPEWPLSASPPLDGKLLRLKASRR